MKKIISILIVTLIVILPICAADGFYSEYERLNDTAELLSDSEYSTILSKLDELSERQKFDVTILTATDLGEYTSAMEYADDIYDYLDYGYGDLRDGIILFISTGTGDCWLSTSGYGIKAFTDYGIEHLLNQLKPDLRNKDFNAAFEKFITLADDYIDAARAGHPYDRSSIPREPLSVLWIPGALIIGFILASLVVSGMKSKLRTVRPALEAGNYVRDNSLKVTTSRDLYLYRNVTKTRKKTSDDNSDSGSSTHTSSSGRTHGGGGIKF